MQDEARNFQVLRIKKRQKTGWGAFLAHSTRLHVPENIDPTRLGENLHFVGLNADSSLNQVEYAPSQLQAKVRERAKKQVDERVGKLRSNAVYVTETIISASKEHLDTMTREEQIEYLKSGVQYVIDKFGADNFISAHFHFDELTPHAHVFTSAVTLDSKTGKHKTHYKAFIDGPQELEKFQDGFHQQIGKKYGLAPNLKKQRATHTELSAFYSLMETHKTNIKTKNLAELSKMVEETYAKNAIEELRSDFEEVSEVLYGITGKTPDKLSHEEFEAFKETFDKETTNYLRLRYEDTRRKRIDAEESKARARERAEEERQEHKQAVVQQQLIQPYGKAWLDSADEYAVYVFDSLTRSRYAPRCQFANPNHRSDLVAFQDRLNALQDELDKFYNDDSVGIRLRESVSRFLATRQADYSGVGKNENIVPAFAEQSPRPYNDQFTSFRLAFARNPIGIMKFVSGIESPKTLLTRLAQLVHSFAIEFRKPIAEIRAKKREEEHRAFVEGKKAERLAQQGDRVRNRFSM